MEKTMFISYAHKDVEAVSRIVDVIEAKVDCKIWFDRNLRGGDEYFSVIADSILECEYFIFIVSPNSVTSNWCIHELEFAMSEQRKIIAIWLEEFAPPPRVRLVISNTHYIRNYEMSEDDLAKTLAETLSAEHIALSRGESEYVVSEQKTDSEKYFLSPEEKSQITKLIACEKNEDYLTCFTAENAMLLGLGYELGAGVPKDEDRAEFYYHVSAYKGSLDGEYLLLALKLSRGTAERLPTVKRMNELAEAGSIKALVYWGDEVYKGNWNMEADKDTAYRWFKRAADMGDPAAKYFLAFGYRVGELGPDYGLCWMYLLEAAQQHFPRAYRQMAFMFKKGLLVEQNLDTARAYYQKAIDHGDGLAVNFIGNMDYEAKDYEAAVKCYKQAADYVRAKQLSNGSPFYNLGWAYEFGQGVEADKQKAIELYFEAARLNHKATKKRLSRLIAENVSDADKMRGLLSEASELNCAKAEYYLAKSYEPEIDGEVEQTKEALKYYEMGADKGCMRSIELLMTYYSWVYGGKEFADREKSLQNFSLYFSLLDLPDNAEFLEERKNSFVLQQNYYTYAVELDIDEKDKKPDKPLALYYYKKCLECERNEKHWHKIMGIATSYAVSDGFGIYYRDIPHSEELAELCFEYFEQVYQKLKGEGNAEEMAEKFIKCYTAIAKGYKESNLPSGENAKKRILCENRIESIKEIMAK